MPSDDTTTFEVNDRRTSSSRRIGVSHGENCDPGPARVCRKSSASQGESSTVLDSLRQLRRIVPFARSSGTLTKLELIRAVIDYIRYLDEMLKDLAEPRSTGNSSNVLPKVATKRIILADMVNISILE